MERYLEDRLAPSWVDERHARCVAYGSRTRWIEIARWWHSIWPIWNNKLESQVQERYDFLIALPW